jgi:DNA topoisomerase I
VALRAVHIYRGTRDASHIYLHDEFKESEHPRATSGSHAGEFAKKGTGGGSPSTATRPAARTSTTAHLAPASPDRASWPAHIRALKIPPAWRDVKISPDPNTDLQAVGRDAKGREQRVYLAKYEDSQAAKKFARIKVLERKHAEITAQNDQNLASGDAATREAAACQRLVMLTGLRPGSERETGAAEQAYGATTLQGQHVVTDGDRVRLRFTGKKGVKIDLPVLDQALAEDLQQRAQRAGPDGQLFGTTDEGLRRYVKTLNGGGFKVKDFRTYLGTSTAAAIVQRTTPPTNAVGYKREVMAVAKEVAQRLGNTPSIALKAYISPVVFSEWKNAAAA